MFHAMVFTIYLLGFRARCSREENDSGDIRIGKIVKLIKKSRFGIHDLSRTELDIHKLPRFNMPFELGVDAGLRYSGNPIFKKKVHLVLDKVPYRYQKYISDIGGQDISAHLGRASKIISVVRDWLRTATNATDMPSGTIIAKEYRRFQRDLPKICERSNLDIHEVTYRDYSHIVVNWLKTEYKKSL
jgi:hypothetical protein